VENYDCESFSIFGDSVYIAMMKQGKLCKPEVIDAIKETFETIFEGAVLKETLAEIVFNSENCSNSMRLSTLPLNGILNNGF
jgi:hypothetical protein